jgi:hypothetical protein
MIIKWTLIRKFLVFQSPIKTSLELHRRCKIIKWTICIIKMAFNKNDLQIELPFERHLILTAKVKPLYFRLLITPNNLSNFDN